MKLSSIFFFSSRTIRWDNEPIPVFPIPSVEKKTNSIPIAAKLQKYAYNIGHSSCRTKGGTMQYYNRTLTGIDEAVYFGTILPIQNCCSPLLLFTFTKQNNTHTHTHTLTHTHLFPESPFDNFIL